MKLVVTGGGTGGHVFPAIEVARFARESGAEVAYFGSLRGQEGEACRRVDLPFSGFPAQPLWSLRTLRGWRSAIGLVRASVMANRALASLRPDVVFSTGGYSSAPIMAVARRLGIPLVIHESNSIPGRSNRIFAAYAHSVGVTFHRSLQEFGGKAQRVGLPVRGALVEAAKRPKRRESVLVVGGSQGALAVNLVAAQVAASDGDSPWVHATGPANFNAEAARSARVGYRQEPYLDTDAMAEALLGASVMIGRAGASTMTELALFGVPGILIPLPSAMDDHQTANAQEFVDLGIASLLPQAEARPERVLELVRLWRSSDGEAVARLGREWYVPDSAARVHAMLVAAVQAGHTSRQE